MALVSQRAYARRRGISQAAVQKRTAAAGGPIPTHGPKKLIDVDEADQLWEATQTPQGAGGAETGRRAAPTPAARSRRRAPRPSCSTCGCASSSSTSGAAS